MSTDSQRLQRAKLERYEQLAVLGSPPPWWRVLARRNWLRRYRVIWSVTLDEATIAMRDVYSIESVTALASQPHPMLSALRRSNERRMEYLVQPIRYGGTYRKGGHFAGCAQFRPMGGDCDCPPEASND